MGCVKKSSQIYNWKRFWCPRIGSINLSDGGYLYDPDSEWGHIVNPDVVPFDSIAMVPCVALLGEPGIGKTSTMKAEQEAINAKIEAKGDQTLWLDLRSYGSEDRFVRNLFENTTFFSWAKGKHRLHVFLDSLDECLLRIDNLAALLIDEFRKYPVERLYLRIACRTADWPNSLEEGLRQLWNNGGMEVYELVPIRRADVAEAAKVNGMDPDTFLGEIDRVEVVPLAIKPITLDFLLNIYRRTGRLPSTQAELYLQGCRVLCEETSESRRDARLTGTFAAEQRMAVAARIATVTVFANRYAISTGVDRGDVPEEDTTIQELCGGSESIDGDQFQVTETAVNETLASGLFSSRGPNRMGWAHQTYAEFLAARYLVHHKMTLTQTMSLIVHPGDLDGKLVPQLHEPAAWLAGMVPDVFRGIMRVDPEVLLRSDVATADVKDRAALVDTLLRLYEEEKLLDRDLNTRGRYRKLVHPGLAEQLRPYICDDTKGIVVRRVAIDIAEACELQTLQDDLSDVVLDPSQPLPIRVNAAYAINRIADDETKEKLKPLATGEAGDDPNDRLKGCGLRAVWPVYMTAEELFAVLTHPKQENHFGAYQLFISKDVEQHLKPLDLPKALEWVEEQAPRHKLPYPFEKLMDAIMLQAWEHLESPGVMEAFAKAALSRLKHHDEIVGHHFDLQFGSVLSGEDIKRRPILEAMLPLLSDPEKNSIWLVHSRTPMVLTSDVPWMIERLRTVRSQKTQRAWAYLIIRAFSWQERDHLRAILKQRRNNILFTEAFSWLEVTIAFYFPPLFRLYFWIKRKPFKHRIPKRPPLKPSPAKRIAKLLDTCESGNCEIWWLLNRYMTLEPDSTHYGNELESDLTVLPGWKTADAATRARIVRAAKRYVLEQDPQTHEWLGTNILHRPAFAGYRALRLLFQEAPGFVSDIPADVWKRWAPIILAYPTSSGVGDEDPHHKLVRVAYQHAPDEVIETLMILIDKENRTDNPIYIADMVEGCWDDDLGNALLVKAKDEKLKPKCMGDLLTDLLDHKVDEARVFAESLVPLPPPSNGERRSKAIVAARVLMTHAEDAGWSVVWPVIQQEVEFGREVISAIAYDLHRDAASIGQRITETQLADLYVWLVCQYPHAEDSKRQVGTAEVRESIADFRNSILDYLVHRGTHKACEAIRRIAGRLPELPWLRWSLAEAQNITRHRSWTPAQPSNIIRIASDQLARLVQSGDQLLDVLIESLERLQSKLQGETPAVREIWDITPISEGGAYRPNDENGFTDYVKRHLGEDLKQRGIVVNREVEIRRGEGSGRGERTDIHVDAVLRCPGGEAYDSVAAIIEVKGCWNQELSRAMETQLVDRYLKDNRCRYGLYLVGWFNCDQWDNDDERKRRVPKIGINEAQERFDIQAAELSQQCTRIRAFVMNTALR